MRITADGLNLEEGDTLLGGRGGGIVKPGEEVLGRPGEWVFLT